MWNPVVTLYTGLYRELPIQVLTGPSWLRPTC